MEQYLSFVTLDAWTFIFTWVNLLILFFIVKKLFMKPVQDMLEERKSEIESDYSDAKNARYEADKMRTEYEGKLSGAHLSAEKIISNATLSADMKGDAIVKEAEEKARIMIERAQKNIDAQHDAAFADIKKEVGDMAVDIAKKIIQKDIDKKSHEEFIDNALNGLGGLNE